MSMKIRWTVFGVIVLSAAVYALWPQEKKGAPQTSAPPAPQPAGRASQPALLLTPATLDFGTVPVGATRSAEVVVTNASPVPVTVYRVSGSCECIGGEVEPRTIPAGKRATTRITFTGVTGKGTYSGAAYLVTDESGPCRYDIPVRGVVLEDLMIEPSLLAFGTLSRKAVVFREARLRHKDGKPFQVTKILGAGDPFEVTVSSSADS